jgi:intraflagellar transport protein 172
MFLEDEGQFKEAEDAFIKAGKSQEAIDMYIHQENWVAASCVADLCGPTATAHVQV